MFLFRFTLLVMRNQKYLLNYYLNASLNYYYGRTPHYYERGKYNKSYRVVYGNRRIKIKL
jgi:hypothetical protein